MASPREIIDAHAHAFPDAATGKAWQNRLGFTEPKRTGAIDELAALMAEGQIDHAVLLLSARSEELYERLIEESKGTRRDEDMREEVYQDIKAYNRWGCELGARDARFIPFIGVNPRFMSEQTIREEIDAMAEAGARGVKIVPRAMQMYGNDRLLFPVYQRAAELGIPVLSQSGGGGGPPPAPGADHFGRPKYFADVLATFPRLNLILAHLGRGGYEEDVVQLTNTYPNAFTDVSMRLSGLGKPGNWTQETIVEHLRRVGIDHILLGSNYPLVNPAVYVLILNQLPLTDEERELIAGGNFQRLVRTEA